MRAAGVAIMIAVSSLALSACSSSSGSSSSLSTIDGVPSLQISVPLAVAACTTGGLCYAAGTTGLDTIPTGAAEVTSDGTTWHGVAVPAAASTIISAASCGTARCLFGGANSGGDVLWRTATDTTMVPTGVPGGGVGVIAVSCATDGSCTLVDTDAAGHVRVAVTRNFGISWSAPRIITTSGYPVSLACANSAQCVIGSSGDTASWTATSNGFATTVSGVGPSKGAQWTQLANLNCTSRRCVARASDANGKSEVVVADFAPNAFFTGTVTWKAANGINLSVNAVACTSSLRCVAVGEHSGAGAVSVATLAGWTDQPLRYVADPLTAAACSKTRCLAISSWTLVNIERP